ncbi:hypothetical protein KJ636_04810 [Patescibacteria group bacterium]|nr:hypothetical protein [Patescibacteria group bacterium]MBU4480797.1 hypothetical protein [Patescibacteria group bacterium]
MKGYLKYVIENCEFALDELCRINKELNEEWDKVQKKDFSSEVDMNYLGAMNRMIQDYLIVRIGGLFDKTEHRTKGGIDEVVSFEKLFSSSKDFEKIKEQEIIKYIIEQRHNFVAHTNKGHVENNFPITSKICNSNLKEMLEGLQKLLKN